MCDLKFYVQSATPDKAVMWMALYGDVNQWLNMTMFSDN